ncbi:relaxase [Dyadobacter luteus]|uniref:Relaxase n=1 Tax=Dyadobacter luteus TaxID=2259619 RepID=A0A3D8Y755_9BACT|nr:relaxase/mobilization nuclease domain-containing protein [Dyadobacter luteus]REA58208.1 relaxase [Dyadobacter luteus]
MVAVIHASGTLRSALNYNERKVSQAVASFLDAGFYLENKQDLNYHSKLSRLVKRNALNPNVKVNTLHISLNFSPDEKLSDERLKEIARSYLAKIGFEKQPYLLYQHHDSGHPHVHLITTTIRADGRAIRLHNIGRNQSEKARKELETEFGLIRAEDQNKQNYELKAPALQLAQYRKTETKKAISSVLHGVLKQYKYASAAELNAVLALYGVLADRGSENSRIYKNQGLVYRLLDQNGTKIGVPIKASDFHFKPTLKYLNARFEINQTERVQYRARIKNAVDLTLLSQSHSVESLSLALKKQGILLVSRRSDQGQIYGLTYIDQVTKCVFNGSALGKTYSAKAIVERCKLKEEPRYLVSQMPIKSPPQQPSQLVSKTVGKQHILPGTGKTASVTDPLLTDLFAPETSSEQILWQLKKSRKKRRRKMQ